MVLIVEIILGIFEEYYFNFCKDDSPMRPYRGRSRGQAKPLILSKTSDGTWTDNRNPKFFEHRLY